VITVHAIVALVFGVAGPALLAVAAWRGSAAVYRLVMGARNSDWPGVPGVVTRAELRTAVIRARTLRLVYYPHVEYAYMAEGVLRTGRRLAVRRLDQRSEGAARRLLERYPPGGHVEVAVNPSRPSCAVLVRGSQGGDVVQLLEAGFIAALGASLTIVGLALADGAPWRAAFAALTGG
jgi:hypothetical protein